MRIESKTYKIKVITYGNNMHMWETHRLPIKTLVSSVMDVSRVLANTDTQRMWRKKEAVREER